ncbi:hypothetical protein D9757_004024 [Collybiopsis confluens]|uniref:F-box domain-containing protein n=1 Tax=Collybiopsis confluens TaxID=2823264 RepID=A0A8H5MEK8_9AGAR|nr:hypothetical protein D9757_004024 [Collybiopsis confluens]
MTVQLPFELWWKILNYLPSDKNIIQLGSVNRVFLEIARQLRYRALEINKVDNVTNKHQLQIIRSFSLGHHVRYLSIRPWSLSILLLGGSRHGPIKKLLSAVNIARPIFGYFERRKQTRKMKNVDKQVDLIVSTMRTLEYVREFELLFGYKEFHVEALTAILYTLAICPFNRTLTKLSLWVPVNRLDCLTPVILPALESLDVKLYHVHTSKVDNTEGYLGHLAVYISGLSQTLRTLSISSTILILSLDFSRFFYRLCEADFPLLHTFHFRIAGHGSVELSGFMLKTGHNLRDLELCHLFSSSHDPPSWITNILTTRGLINTFSSLNSLYLGCEFLPGKLTLLLALISSVASQLESFSFEYTLLTLEEVEMVIRALSCSSPSPLRHLVIESQFLSPSIFGLLASEFPQLETLKINYETLSSTLAPAEEDALLTILNLPPVKILFYRELVIFSEAGVYAEWKLSRLRLCCVLRRPILVDITTTSALDPNALRTCFPSLVDCTCSTAVPTFLIS